ncbi:MAG TPA: YifB family Mg chelatase-like AAA ATPase [Bacteroidales bacterium]|nr:YifB family Mg chelatase-like AAA ATPase [Bacteroidales bacterium]
MLVKTYASAVQGIQARTITVEVNATRGYAYNLVGLPDNAVKESQYRILSAYSNNGFTWPAKKIVINMAPADVRKEGSSFDLPLAIGILAASGQIEAPAIERFVIMGELSLDGLVKPVKGALPIAINAAAEGFEYLILPEDNAREAAVVQDIKVIAVNHISEVIHLFNTGEIPEPVHVDIAAEFARVDELNMPDFSEVKGQENVKRALEIAAAGGHNLIMIGAPGAGKTMLARRMPGILPPLSLDEALETTKIHSVAGKTGTKASLITQRPFRSPHHTISDVAMVGGGSYPQPGEISLAHNGVLFLDELPEFKRTVLEVMRQPLEDRVVTISRAKHSVEYPAAVMLIASMNPCPCGFYNHPEKRCLCTTAMVQKYLSRISGPLLDRIDIHLEVVPVPFDRLAEAKTGESSAQIRERVIAARQVQSERFKGIKSMYCNAQMNSRQLRKYCVLDETSMALLKTAMERLGLSARAYDRIIKVSRTIADLEGEENISSSHIAEAIQYRSLDREGWAG